MKSARTSPFLRPLTSSLSRFKSAVSILAALGFASQHTADAAPVSWEGNTGGTPGDGFLWLNALNWQGDLLPSPIDDAIFGVGILGDIQLGTNQTVNSLSFNTSTDLGVFGESNILTNTTGSISVNSGSTVVINANVGGVNGLSLTGGGTLQLTNPLNSFTGNISVSGAGTTLLAAGFAQPAAINRSDILQLGLTSRTITLTNGGTFKIAGNSYNPDGTTKIFALGAGGGTINVAAGFQHFTLDDGSQVTAVAGSSLSKNGKGALQITSQDYNLDLTGGVTVDGGLLRLSRIQGNTGNGRVSAFTIGTPITINSGGALVVETGTQGILDNNVTLNPGGILAINGNEHNIGLRDGGPSILNLNGGTILVRDGFNPQSSGRLPRIDSRLVGNGTIDLIGGTANAGNSRLVMQRADVNSTFSGTFVVHGNTALEQNQRDNDVNVDTGNTFASSTIDLRGHNAALDVRDSTTGTVNLSGYNTTSLKLSGEAGSLGRIAAGRSNTAAGTGHVYEFKNFTAGSNRLYITNNNNFGLRFSGATTLTGVGAAVPTIDLNAGGGVLEFDGAINEHLAGDGLVRQGRNGIVGFSNAVNLGNVTLRTLETRLFGANGAIGAGALSATSSITVNSGWANVTANNASTGTVLHLNNNYGNLGGSVAAATNGDRLADNVRIDLLGDSTLRLTSQSGLGVAETTGNITIVGRPTIDVVKTGVTTSPVVLTLGTTTPVLTPGSAANVTGTNLGGIGADSSRVIIPGIPTVPFLGANITSGNEWARHDATVDSGFALGVIAWTNTEYGTGLNAVEADWVGGMHVKLNGGTGTALGASRTVETLNLQFSAANQAINTSGSLLTVGGSGIIVAANTAGITGGALGGITAGTSASPSGLMITNNSQLDLNARIDNNSFGGVVTLIKNGPGILRLTNQGFGVGAGNGGVGSIVPATHTNTFTGGIVVNQGRLVTFRPEYLGSNTITLNGGALDLDVPVAPSATNTVLNFGNNVVINANSGLYSDDNGEANDASAGGNATFALGSLTVNGNHIVGFGTFGNGQASAAASGGSATDFRFNNANFTGTPTFQLGGFRSGNAALIVQGNLAGTGGFNVETMGDTVGAFQLGSGGTDNVANTYSGVVSLIRTSGNGDAVLRLDKANGTTAITGDVIINGGTLAWGTSAVLDKNSNVTIGPNSAPGGIVANQWTGNSNATAFLNTTSGNHQIADNATVTLMFGTLNESGRLVNEKFGTLRQLNGNFNTGTGLIEVDTYEMSGGSVTFNSGGTFKAGTINLLSGAQEINVGNAFSGAVSTLQVGSGGITINGQNLSLGNGDYFTPSAGGVLKLGGTMTVQADPLNFTNTDRQRGIFTGGNGRELGPNFIDFDGGNRTVSVSGDIFYTFNVNLRNGGLIKTGEGSLAIQNWATNTYSGGVTVNNGNLLGRSATALGTGPGDVNSGGTLKMDGGWTWGNSVTLSGPGADIPESGGILEQGAFVSESGANRLTGNVAIDGGAAIASNFYAIPNTAGQGAGGGVGASSPFIKSNLTIAGAGGVTGTGTLILTGGGDGTIANGVNTTGALVKAGSGTWSLGTGTYSGTTEIQAGVLRTTGNGALGTTAAGTTVRGGATLLLDGTVTTAEPLSLAGAGAFGGRGALESSGTNVVSGPITLSSNATIRSASGSLAVNGAVTGGKVLTLSGTGNGTISGNITNAVPSGDALVKNGTGTWTLRGNNAIGGSTLVNGGTLALNTTGTALSTTAAVQLAGGSLSNLGSAQTIGGLNLLSGGANVAGGAGLNIGAISRNPGASVNFSGTVTTTTPNGANGIIGSWATYGSNWATGGGAISGFSAYTTLANRTGNVGLGNHGLVAYDSNGYANGVHTVGITAETLKIAPGVKGLQTGAQTIDLLSGGILKDGPQTFHLGGGLISGGGVNNDLNVHVAGGGLYVANALIGAGTGSLNKSGPGELRLFGTSAFTGSVNVNGGTLTVPGQVNHPGTLGAGVTNANRALNLNGGTFSVASGDYDLNDFDAVTAGIQSMQFVVGSAGGTLHSENGTILINDAGQFSGSGDLRITGGGRVALDTTYPNFTGNITVGGGTLRLSGGIASNQLASQKVTLEPNTAVILNGDMSQAFEFQGNNQLTVTGADRMIRGPVTFNGNVHLSMLERDNLNTARSVQFAGPISGSGTLNISGVNTNGRVQFAGGFSDYTGTVNVGPNSAIEIRQPGSFGTDLASPTINLNGSRSRLLLRHYQSGDWNLDVNANGKFTEIYAGRLDSYGLGTQGLYSIKSLTATANNYLTFTGDNNNWVTVNGSVTAAGNSVLVTNTNTLFRQGATVGGILDKRGGSVLAVEGPLAVAGKAVIQQGWIDLRGSAGKITGATGIEIRGGNLMLSNNVETGSDPNRVAGIPISLGGGSIRVIGTTNLGPITLAPGTSEINYAMDTQSGITPLVINDVGATRAIGSQLRVNSTFGTIGAPTNTGTNPRIHVTGLADSFGTGAVGNVDIIPYMVFSNNFEFVAYRSTSDAGQPLGLVQVANGSMRADAADGVTAGQLRSATAATEIMRFTGTTTTALGGNATWRAIKMDGGATRTIDVGTNTLTVDRGHIIFVSNNNQRIGLNTGAGFLTSGNSELHITANQSTSLIGAVIANGPAGAVNLVKNGGGGLQFDGAADNTFTGNVHLNGGVLVNNRLGHIPAASTVFFNGGRWEPNPAAVATTDVLAQNNNIVVNARSVSGDPALSLDNGNAQQDNDIAFGSVTINNGIEWSIAGHDSIDGIFNATPANPHVFNGTPTIQLFQGRQAAAASESTMTFAGPITGGGFYVSSIGGRNGTNPNDVSLNIGGGATDTVVNSYAGEVTILGTGATNSFPTVRLNKAAGTTAITGDFTINGGQVILQAANQIADTANVIVNGDSSGSNPFSLQLNGQAETINNLTVNGGGITTGVGALTANNITVNGGIASADHIQINSNGGTVTANGVLTMGDFGRVTLGASNATLVINGGLQMTGGLINQNGGTGANIVRLNSGVTATSSIGQSALLGNSTDSDTFLELNGNLLFNVADGPQGNDLAVGAVVRDSTGVGATPGGITKAGSGLMVLQGGATGNSYTGPTIVSAGTLDLNKNGGVVAIPTNLTVGGSGNPAVVRLRANDQIANTANVSLGADATLDLQAFNTSDTVGSLSGSAGSSVLLGPSSALTVSIGSDTEFAGNITGGGAENAITKNGSGKWTLSGVNEFIGNLVVNGGIVDVVGSLNGSAVTVNNGSTLQGSGSVADVFAAAGGVVSGGSGVGELEVRNLDLSLGTLSATINGNSLGSTYDVINATGNVTLGGNLSVSGSYVPSFSDALYLLVNDGTDAFAGTFAGINQLDFVVINGMPMQATYTADFENSNPYSTTGNDFALIPEPGSASLLLGGLGSLLALRRRRRS